MKVLPPGDTEYYFDVVKNFEKSFKPELKSNWQATEHLYSIDFTMDTVVVFSANQNPQKYIYTYTSEYQRESILRQKKTGDVWVNTSQNILEYNDAGNLSKSLWQEWDNDAWQNTTQTTYQYNDNSNLLSFLTQVWSNNSWINSRKGNNTYGPSGNIVAYLEEIWSASNGSWGNFVHNLYTYDDDDNLLSAFGEVWVDTIWVNDQRITYVYNNSNFPENITLENWYIDNWYYTYYEEFSYDEHDNLIQYTGMTNQDETWINDVQLEYVYNDLDWLTESVQKNWEVDAWINDEYKYYTYNNFGGKESELVMNWDEGLWVNQSLTNTSFDEFGNSLQADYYVWNNGSWAQLSDGILKMPYNYCQINTDEFTGYRVEAVYTSLIVQAEELESPNGNIWPNPARDITYLKMYVENESKACVHLYNSSGTMQQCIYKVMQPGGMNEIEMELARYPTGLYFLQIMIDDKHLETKKLIIIK